MIFGISFSPDGKSAATVGAGTQPLIVWDLASGKALRSWDGLPVRFQGAAFAADGRHLITANSNGTAYVLRLAPPTVGSNISP